MKKDAILVLAHTLQPGRVQNSRVLSRETETRVETAVDMYARGDANFILMQGGPGVVVQSGEWGSRQTGNVQSYWVPLGSRPVISDQMKVYAQHLGVPEHRIFIQPHSCDNVGEAIFAYGMYLRPQELNWKNNFVVTSDYNVPRATEVYTHVLGSGFSTDVVGALSGKVEDLKILETERNNLKTFQEQFGDVPPGDLERLLATLYEKHPYYKIISEKYRIRFQ